MQTAITKRADIEQLEGRILARLISFGVADVHGDVYKADMFYKQENVPVDLPNHEHTAGIAGRADLIFKADGIYADITAFKDTPEGKALLKNAADRSWSWFGYQTGAGHNISNVFIAGITDLTVPPANPRAETLTVKSAEVIKQDDDDKDDDKPRNDKPDDDDEDDDKDNSDKNDKSETRRSITPAQEFLRRRATVITQSLR